MKLAALVIGLCISGLLLGNAWAAEPAKPAPSAEQVKIDQQVAQRNAEIERLRQGVKEQEAKSRETDQRLKQQDRTVAELQQQLNALKAAPDAAKVHH
jgi:septal ring factor EnvC (AmiA/AmiB activator)